MTDRKNLEVNSVFYANNVVNPSQFLPCADVNSSNGENYVVYYDHFARMCRQFLILCKCCSQFLILRIYLLPILYSV